MKLSIVAAMLITGISSFSSALANPDGPVGSIVVTSRYVQTNKEGLPGGNSWSFSSKELRNSELDLGIAIPLTGFLTVGLDAVAFRRQGTTASVFSSSSGAWTGEFARVDKVVGTQWGASIRVYVPFTRSARAELGR